MSQAAELLRNTTLFAGVPDDHLDSLAGRASDRFLEAGEWLFRHGDPGDALFVVAHGSVEVMVESPEPVVVGIFGRGDSLGELALLTGGPRSVAARAKRDSQLICISREDFDTLLETQPRFAVALVRVLGERLTRARPMDERAREPVKALSLVALHDGVPVESVADQLASSLREFGPVVQLQELNRRFSYMESANQWVLLVAPSPDLSDSWTQYCIRQADRVIGVATTGRIGAPSGHEQLRGCDVAFLARPGAEPDLEGWLDTLEPRTTYVLRDRETVGVERMARRLAGKAIGVVLSGGGARGIAHIGAIEELQRSGFVIDRIGGTSMGAAIGSLFAEGRSADEVAAVVEEVYVRDDPLRGRTIPIVALSRGEKGFAVQQRVHGERRIESLDIPFFCLSADLVAQQMVVHRSGLMSTAVSAAQALPGFLPPLQDGDRMLIDGAIFSNLPVEPMQATGEGPVIAVDVSGRLPPPGPPRTPVTFLRRWIAGPAAEWAPNITETIMRSVLLGNAASDAAAREVADVVIAPQLREWPMMRFRDVDVLRQFGRDAVRDAVAAGALDRLRAE
jgi:NTE family protein